MRACGPLLVALLVAHLVAAQAPPLAFRHLTLADDLPEGSISQIAQDRSGFIWLGTGNGLLRYDGTRFERFQPDPVDRNSLSGRLVTALVADGDGAVWVGTRQGGLSRFDPRGERFFHYRHRSRDHTSLASDAVGALLLDSSGNLWVGSAVTESAVTENRQTESLCLSLLDRTNDTFSHVWIDSATRAEDGVTAMVQDQAGRLWIGTLGSGLLGFDPETRVFTSFRHDPARPGSLSDDHVLVLVADRRGNLWIGTWGGGVNRLKAGAESFEHLRFDPGEPGGLSDDGVMSLCVSSDGALWIGTRNNVLHRYDPDRGTFRQLRHDPADPRSRSAGLGPRVIFEDRTGTLWVGADGVGLDLLDPYASKFQRLLHDPHDPHSLGPGIVQSLLVDRTGAVWVGTGEGLNRIDPDSHTVDRDAIALGSGEQRSVLSLLEDRRGRLWIGTRSGLYSVDPGTGRATAAAAELRLGGSIQCLLEGISGKIWIGTRSRGLELLDPETSAVASFAPGTEPAGVSDRHVSALVQEKSGVLWVGTAGGGLNRLDPATGEMTVLTSSLTGLDVVLALHLDREGRLWAGTENGGLHLVEPEIGTRLRITERGGLAHDTVHAIVEDGDGRLWIATGRGLTSFDPETRQCRIYDAGDGLAEPRLSGGAVRDRRGTIYLGSPAGVHFFRPDRLEDDPHPPPVVFTSLRIFNQPVEPGPGSPLAVPIPLAGEIRLAPEHRVFTLGFAALHYAHPDRNRYAFRLEPFDADWNQVGGQRQATYTNLAPGRYLFRVKAANSDGVWNTQGASLRIVVAPPWWRTGWARAGFAVAVLLLLAAVAWLQRWRVQRRERLRSQQREARLRAEAAEAQARAAEAEAQVVREESRRKSAELEAARDLQLAMLPETLPEHPTLRIAAAMTTATEVGGDYYDFGLCTDGSLLAALGDASGHGLQAGMVVMTAKSLFVALPPDPDLASVLQQGNQILRRMRLRRLNMALALARITGDRIEAASAGIPPLLVYRDRDGVVQELGEGGVPLGGMPGPTYRRTSLPFTPGDVVLMMSDGFAELRNPAGEQLGYERAREAFRAAAASRDPEAIVAALRGAAAAWSEDRPRDDDMTFVAISRR